MQKAKAIGMEAYLTVDTLVVSSKRYTVNDLDELPSDLNPARIATSHIGDMVCLFGGMSPLSKIQAQKVMIDGIKCKFDQNEHLKRFLLETGDKLIVETNPYDNYRSCGLSVKDNDKLQDRNNWPGANNLGIILTDICDAPKINRDRPALR